MLLNLPGHTIDAVIRHFLRKGFTTRSKDQNKLAPDFLVVFTRAVRVGIEP
jgi:hypothetical protein